MEQNTNLPPENISASPLTPPAPKSQNWLIIGLGILLFFSLGSTGFLFYQNSQLKNQIAQLQVTPTPVVLPSPSPLPIASPTPDLTVNWKTYTNSKYKFSVKYPDDFRLKEWPGRYDDTFSVSISNQETDSGSPLGLEDLKMLISIFAGGSDFKRKDFYYGGYQWVTSILDDLLAVPVSMVKDHKYDLNTKLRDIKGDGFIGVKYKSVPKKDIPTTGFPHLNAALSRDGRTILISATVGGDPNLVFSKPYSETFDQILSTFNFIR